MKTISTVVHAAAGCCGQYDQLRRRGGEFEARTIRLYTHGKPARSAWQPISTGEAAAIIAAADDPVPAPWLAATRDA